jgi:Flp pilus assembly protein TadB
MDKKKTATPRRKDAERSKKNPIIQSDKKLAKKEQKKKLAEIRELRNRALETGDDKYLPLRDKGEVKRATRDYIDSHTSFSEFFMIFACVIIALFFVTINVLHLIAIGSIVIIIMYLFMIIVIFESILKGIALKKFLHKKFNKDKIPRGTIWYGISRSLQLRGTRLPKPQVKRGDYPS